MASPSACTDALPILSRRSSSFSNDANDKVAYRAVTDPEERLKLARMPSFSVVWYRSGHIFVGGGGGQKGTGVPSGLTVNKLDKNDMFVPIGFFDTQDMLVYAMTTHPTEPTIVCAMNEYTYILEWKSNQTLSVKYSFRSDFKDDEPFQTSIAISRNGKTIGTGGDDSTVRLFDYQTSSRLEQFTEHTKSISSISFNTNSDIIASTAMGENECNIWKADQSLLWKLNLRSTKTKRKLEFRGCCFSKQEASILFAWMNDANSSYIVMWDITRGSVVKRVRLDAKPCVQGAISADGSLIAVTTVYKDASLYVFDCETLELVGKHHHLHALPMTGLDFSPDCQRLVTVSADMSYAIVPSRTRLGCSRCVILLCVQLFFAVCIFLFLRLQSDWTSYPRYLPTS